MAKTSSDAANILAALKKTGKLVGATMLNDEDSPCVINEWISTGCLVLDAILGGGIPVGRLTEFYGEQSSGKSLIGAQIVATAQQLGHVAAYCDTEAAVSRDMMTMLGVDIDNLIYSSPNTVEEVFEHLDELIETEHKIAPDQVLVFVWDSVAATSADAEMEKEYGQTGYLTHARVISQSLRKITRKMSKERIACIFLNQTRENIGAMFGDAVTTFGGKAIPFHSSIRVALKLANKLKLPGKRAKIVGMNTRAVVVKNKVAVPYQDALLPIYFGHGIDDPEATRLWLTDAEIITGTGWKTLALPGYDPIKFQNPGWPEIYENNYAAISEVVMSGSKVGEIGEVEIAD